MYKTINFDDFLDSFSDTYKNNFTYEGKKALFDYLESYEEETDTKIELDVIALCCEYTEFRDFADFSCSYSSCTTKEDIENYTTVIDISGTDGFIIQNY